MNYKFLKKCSGVLLLILFSCTAIFAQERTVTGVVVDNQSGEKLPGAIVSIKGKPSNVSTDQNGSFSIKANPEDSVLVVSFIGYTRKMENISGQSQVTISMQSNSADLNDVVVVGYGTQKRANLTGSVATVNMKQIEELPMGNLSALLKGSDNLPGVHISGGEDRPGTPASIVIRNPPQAAKNGGTSGPLYVIDDVVRTVDDFNDLDPSEVESISVLKDGLAAVYGARAGLGVILVKTKRGQVGTPRISYSGSYDISDATYFPKMLNGAQQATYLNDYLIGSGKDSTNSGYYTPDEIDYFKQHNYNWLDEAWKPSVLTRQSLNISGGTKKATFFAGANYYFQNGNLDKIDYKKWTFRASSNINVTDNLKVGLSLSGAMTNNKLFFLKQGGENTEKDITNLLSTPQFIPPYVNGLPVYLPGGSGATGFHFFEAQKLNNYTLSRDVTLNVNANIEYNFPFIPGLKAIAAYNRNLSNSWGKQYGTKYNVYQFAMGGGNNHIYEGDPKKIVSLNNGDRIRINPGYSDDYQFNAGFNYTRSFGKHNISLLGMVEQAETYSETTSAMKEGVLDVGVDYMRAALGTMTVDNSASATGTLSYVGRVDYNYDEKYIFQFAFRKDASTNFAPQNRWGFFPTISGAWIISQENFLKNVSWINFLKLRASVGFLGTDRTVPYSYLQRYTLQQSNGAVFGGNSDRNVGIKLENLPNYLASWDNIDHYDAGIDANFLNNRLAITQDIFLEHGYNLLSNLSASSPFTIGSTMPAENFATTNSYGYELNINWKDKISNDFGYSINTGWGITNTKYILADVAAGDKGGWQDLNGKTTRKLGVMGFEYAGMFRTQQQVDDFLAKNPNYTLWSQKPAPGMLYYKDIRGPKQADGTYAPPDGLITDDDMTYIHPKIGFSTGVSLGLNWKGLDLHVKTSFSIGGETLAPSAVHKLIKNTASGPEFWADHWTPENTNAQYPSPYYNQEYDQTSSFWFVSSNSFNISLINLSYTMPQKMMQSIGVNGCRFYMVVTNPLQLQNKTLLGYDLTYPVLRTFSFGVNLNL